MSHTFTKDCFGHDCRTCRYNPRESGLVQPCYSCLTMHATNECLWESSDAIDSIDQDEVQAEAEAQAQYDEDPGDGYR